MAFVYLSLSMNKMFLRSLATAPIKYAPWNAKDISVSVPAELSTSFIKSVSFFYQRRSESYNGAIATNLIRFADTTINVDNESLKSKLENGDLNFDIRFSCQAYNAANLQSGVFFYEVHYSDISILVEYEPYGSVYGTINFGTSSIASYSFIDSNVSKDESCISNLIITPDVATTKVAFDIGVEASGETEPSSYITYTKNVDISSRGSQQVSWSISPYGIEFPLGDRVLAAYVRVRLNAGETNEEVSDWTLTELNLIDYRNVPSCTLTRSDTSGKYSTFGVYLQNKSAYTITVGNIVLDTEADEDITVASKSLIVDGVTYTSSGNIFIVPPINKSGTIAYTFTITDTRGKTNTMTGSWTQAAYASPAISDVKMQRYNPDTGELDDNQETIRISLTGNVTSIDSGTSGYSKNAWTLTAKYINDSSTTVTHTMASGSDGTSLSYTNDTSMFPYELNVSKDYDIEVTLADSVESSVYHVIIHKAGGLFNIETTGVAVGMRTTGTLQTPLFESAYTSKFYKPVQFTDEVEFNGEATFAGPVIFNDNVTFNSNLYMQIGDSLYQILRASSGALITTLISGGGGTGDVMTLFSNDTALITVSGNNCTYDSTAWNGNVMSRPAYTANGNYSFSEATTNGCMLLSTTEHSSGYTYYANVSTINAVTVPASATKLKIQVNVSSGTSAYLYFGLLPSNASSCVSDGDGGQISGLINPSTGLATYTLNLSSAMIGTSAYNVVITLRSSKTRTARIYKVWFE